MSTYIRPLHPVRKLRDSLSSSWLSQAAGIAALAALTLLAAPAHAQVKIMPLGDSITYGLSLGQPSNQMYPNGYRGRLQDLLQTRAAFADDFDFIGLRNDSAAGGSFDSSKLTTDPTRYDGDHNGYSSYTTARTYGSSPGDLNTVLTTNYTSANFDPDIVLLHVGINDIVGQNASAANLQTDYRTLLTTIYGLKPDVQVYISTIMYNRPATATFPPAQQVELFNAYLASTEVGYWQGQGKSITLVDMHTALEGSGYGTQYPAANANPHYGTVEAPSDRVHPNAAGYQAMAEAWNTAIVDPSAPPAGPKNVVFIYVDDLRPEFGAYGATHVVSPNMDTLASQGLTFNRAYVQQALCHPSRISTLTGTRPDTNGVTDLTTDFRDRLPDIQTLPELFKDNGYTSVGFGKIYHAPDVNDALSWSEGTTGFATQYHDPVTTGNPPFEEPTNSPAEADYADAKIAGAAITRLETLASDYAANDTPFFMAVGFLKPHLPFVAPKAYWDLYDRNTIPISTGADALPPTNPVSAYLRDGFSGELGSYPTGQPSIGTNPTTDITLHYGNTRIYPESYARALTEGYYACVSFIDAQVGRLLDALDDPNDDGDNSDSLVDDTIIVLIGDHGFHLGDEGSWPKHTNFEIANRAPLIIRAPGMAAAGATTNSIVEFIDIYPTLAELAGLSLPAHLEGTSFAAILDDETAATKNHAVIQYPRSSGNADYMSYSIRTDRYHYIEWRRLDNGLVAFRELYDHQTDPDENANIAHEAASTSLIASLASDLATEVGAPGGDMPGGTDVYEGFFYDRGILESNDIGGRGFMTGWFGWSDLQYSNSGTQILDGTWSTPAGYGWRPFGRVAANGTNGNQPTRALLERNHIDLGADGTRYFSFLYRPDATEQTFRLWFYTDDGATKALQLESQNLNLKLGFASTSLTPQTFTAGEDYLVVGKITSLAAGNDTLAVNIYHSGDTVPASEPVFTHSRSADSALVIDRLVLGVPFNSTESGIRFDEFRMADSYQAVVGTGAATAAAPIAYDATISGTPTTGEVLSASYTWFDANAADSETGTSYQWLRSTNDGLTWSAISGATASTYVVQNPDAGARLAVEITPGSSSAPATGGAALSTATAPVSVGGIGAGLLGHWPFDDQADPTRDISANDYDAAITDASFVPGKFGSGLAVSGNDSAQVGDIPLTGTTHTFAAWVKQTGNYSSGTWEMILGKGWTSLAFGVNTSTDQLRLQIRLSDGSDFFAQENNAATLIPNGVWTHVAGVRDGNTIRLFIGGSEITPDFTSGAATLAPADTTTPLFLGSHTTFSGNYWRGQIDDVRIYERALDPSEIALLAAYDPFNTGDPVLDWKNEKFAGLPEGANDPQAADGYDIEPDGLTNLAEYAFGFDPFASDPPPVAVNPSQHFQYRRLTGSGSGTTESGYTVEGLTYTPQISNTLMSGSWNSGSSWLDEVGTPTDNGDGTETVTLRALTPETTPTGPADSEKHFFRLNISR